MPNKEEKEILYDLMRQIIEERRILSKLYFDLKDQLNKMNSPTIKENNLEERPRSDDSLSTKFKREKEIQEANYFRKNRTAHQVPFERIANNIVCVLKQSPVPLSNKELISRLTSEFEMEVSYSNLTCNILPKMHRNDSIPVSRACRGYWQYKK